MPRVRVARIDTSDENLSADKCNNALMSHAKTCDATYLHTMHRGRASHVDRSEEILSANASNSDDNCQVNNALESHGKICDATCQVNHALALEQGGLQDEDIMSDSHCAESKTAMAIYRILQTNRWSARDTGKRLHTLVRKVTPDLVLEVVRLLKNAKVALNFLNWARVQEGYEPRAEAFTHIVARLGRERDFSTAWCLLDEMKRHDMKVDYAFSIFIHRLKRAKKAHGLVKAMCGMAFLNVTPTVPLYTSALEFLLKGDHGDEAEHLYKQMLQDGLVPDKKLYELLIMGFSKVGKLDESLALFKDMKSQGYVPHVSVYTSLISWLLTAENLDMGHQLYMEMIGNGHLPKVFGSHEVACALHGEDTMEQVDKFLEVVRMMATRWRIQSYNNLLQYLLDVGKCDEAMAVFNRIPGDQDANAGSEKQLAACCWTLDSYRIYIFGMCKMGRLVYALEVLREMLVRGYKPTSDISSFLLLSLSSAKMVDEALELCKHITKTKEAVSIDAQQCFFSALRASGRLGLACKVFLSMRRKGCIDKDSDFVSLVGFENKDDLYSSAV